jgi:hypothetical protein
MWPWKEPERNEEPMESAEALLASARRQSGLRLSNISRERIFEETVQAELYETTRDVFLASLENPQVRVYLRRKHRRPSQVSSIEINPRDVGSDSWSLVLKTRQRCWEDVSPSCAGWVRAWLDWQEIQFQTLEDALRAVAVDDGQGQTKMASQSTPTQPRQSPIVPQTRPT